MGVASARSWTASTGDSVDRSGFGHWIAPHWSAMTGLALRLVGPNDAEDVVQDAVAAAWRLRHRFDEGRGSARAWLFALTADHAHRSLRRAKRGALTVHLADVGTSQASDVHADPDLAAAIGKLSARQRLAVTLYYYLDLPISEVAAAMRCSDGTAKSTLADARRRLRGLLGDDDDD
jgi:RNA polymerase sigma factor (sigma-70 family)